MNTVEDRLRATARALAEAIPDDSPPPRRAPAGNDAAARRSRWRARPWLIPLAAAMAVLAAVAASLTITHGWNAHHATPPSSRVPGPHGGVPEGALPRGVPPYCVAINPPTWHAVAVRSTATGRTLAVPGFGKTWFPQVVGTGANDRTFVVWAQTTNLHGPGRFFLLHFNPDGDRTTLVPLTVHLPDGVRPDMMAVSPDGGRLAVAYQHLGWSVTVFNLSTGGTRTWSNEDLAFTQNGSLSWSANGQTVQYGLYDRKTSKLVYGLLNTSAPGTALPARTIPVRWRFIGAAIVSANGTLVAAGSDSVSDLSNGTWWLARFAAATGRPLGGQMSLGGLSNGIGWASADSGLLIMDVEGGKVRGTLVLGAQLRLRVGGGSLGVGVGGVAW